MLKQLRKNSGLKVSKISELLHVSRMQYYNYENNITVPDHNKQRILSSIFNVPLESIKECFVEVQENDRGREETL